MALVYICSKFSGSHSYNNAIKNNYFHCVRVALTSYV